MCRHPGEVSRQERLWFHCLANLRQGHGNPDGLQYRPQHRQGCLKPCSPYMNRERLPVCLKRIPAEKVVREGLVIMEKNCHDHGSFPDKTALQRARDGVFSFDGRAVERSTWYPCLWWILSLGQRILLREWIWAYEHGQPRNAIPLFCSLSAIPVPRKPILIPSWVVSRVSSSCILVSITTWK